MERLTGIGGVFLRSADPDAHSVPGTATTSASARTRTRPWQQDAGPTVFAGFAADTDYFGSPRQQVMLNFRVGDLDAMLAQLRAAGADVSDDVQDMDGVGRFGWVTDPDGNRV